MASSITRFDIEKLDGNIVQNHGGSKQVGLKQLGSKQVGFKQLGHKQGAQGNRETEDFRVSNDDAAVAQRRLEDEQLEERTNTDCLVKEQEKGNVVGRKKRRSKEAKLGNLLKYKAWLTRRSPVRGSSIE
ncbi:hypothetical protein Tco_0386925 [Tanacetum coccineum]